MPLTHVDRLVDGQTNVLVTESSNDGTVTITTNKNGGSAGERIRIDKDGAIGIGGANFGNSGQVLTSGGSGAAVSWADAAGGGATGGSSDKVFFENGTTVTTNYTIGTTFGNTSACNAMSAGPITINANITVTVNAGSSWTVI